MTDNKQSSEQQNKNAVFASGPTPPMPASPGIQEISRQEYAKSQFGFELPVDAVPLPSKGLIYPDDHPLKNKDMVEYKAMTAREEDILMNAALIKKGTVVYELIKSCLVDKRIDPADLISGDRNALMIAIRATGYDTIYSPSFECPRCSHKNTLNIDLSELPIRSLEIEPVRDGENLFTYTLPFTKKEVQFKFLTVKEEESLIADLNMAKKKNIGPSAITARLRTSIAAVDGNSSRSFIAQFVENMPAKDSLALRKYIDENEPGVLMNSDFTCIECDHSDTIVIPMDATFFWPNAAR